MKSILRSSFALIAALALTAAVHAAVEVGKPAPDFTLTDVEGKSHKLSDFAGKVVVLEWVNLGCPYVKKHYGSQNMQNLHKMYGGKGVVWLGICSSATGQQGYFDSAGWKAEITKQGIASAAILVDEPGTVGHLYGAKTTPHMFIVDGKGVLAYQGGIDSIKSPNPGDIAKATNYVAAALDAMLAGKPVPTATSEAYGCSVKYK